MVYFDSEMIQIPRHFNENPSVMTLTNELTGDVREINVEDMSDNPRMYVFHLGDLGLIDGTYRYNLGSEVGLMQVGEYVRTSQQYNEKKQNTVYER